MNISKEAADRFSGKGSQRSKSWSMLPFSIKTGWRWDRHRLQMVSNQTKNPKAKTLLLKSYITKIDSTPYGFSNNASNFN